MNDIDALTPLDDMDAYLAAGDLDGVENYLISLEKYGINHPIYKEARSMLKRFRERHGE